MKRKAFLFAVGFIFLSLQIAAQITLTQADAPQTGDEFINASADTTGVVIGPAGTNQTWDYSLLDTQEMDTLIFVDPDLAPDIDSFPTANRVSFTNGIFNYFNITSSEFLQLGTTIDFAGTGDMAVVTYDPAAKQFVFPGSYGTSFRDSFSYEILIEQSGFGFRIKITTVRDNNVDGYGTLILPGGGTYNALRMHTVAHSVDSTWNNFFGDWALASVSEITDESFTYLTKEAKGQMLSINLDEDGEMLGVNYMLLDNSSGNAPTAFFTFENEGDGQIQFTDLSSNDPTSWAWDFGDGGTSTQQNPQHTFTSSGEYSVCLIVSNASGADTTCQDVNIILEPEAYFTFTDQGGGTIDFMDQSSNAPTSWSWDFNDGTTSTLQNPQHTFTTAGEYEVCLTVTNEFGSDTFCEDIGVGLAPEADFFYNYQVDGLFFFFDVSSNAPTSWSWDFGDGNSSTEKNPQHTYASTGTYQVCLIATNDIGADTVCYPVVYQLAPVAFFDFTHLGGGVFNFTDLSSNTPTSWAWDFGDGNTSTQTNPQHTYTATGDYTVCMIASNEYGADTICHTLYYGLSPEAAFTYAPGGGDGVFNFTDVSTNDPTAWAWDFGDGNTSTMQNPQHTFAAPGTYTTCLIATNNFGTDTTCMNIQYGLSPEVAFTYEDMGSGLVQFTDASTNDPTAWAWTFGDNGISVEQNPQHTFIADGNYEVCLTAVNSFGANMFCQTIAVVITSVNDARNSIGLKLFPNPTQENVNIKLNNYKGNALNLRICNAQAQEMYKAEILNEQTITVSNWAEGVYLYYLRNEDGQLVTSGRFVVSR